MPSKSQLIFLIVEEIEREQLKELLAMAAAIQAGMWDLKKSFVSKAEVDRIVQGRASSMEMTFRDCSSNA